VPLDPTSTLRVELSLQPDAASLDAPQPSPQPVDLALHAEPRDEASPWNFVLGGVLVAGGLALATIEPVQAAAKDGECADAACDRVYSFGARSGLQVAGGAVLAGAGVALLIWQPLRVEAHAGSAGARIALHGYF
jgi:hypothetical protein